MRLKILFFLPILMLTLAACSSTAIKTPAAPAQSDRNAGASGANIDSLAREDQQGQVTVTVTPINLSRPGQTLDFDVSLQTHMVDLSMDIASLSSSKTDTGVSIKATAWDGPKGGHHVKGKLSFPGVQNGKSILIGVKTLTVTIQNVDAAERTFSWEISE